MRNRWQHLPAFATMFLLTAVLAALTPCSARADAIRWAPDLETAQAQASREGRLVLVHFWSDDCPPCRALEANVFSRPEVAEAINSQYIPVKVHAKRRSDLARQYDVDRWPTDVVITPSGQKITSMVSPQDPQQYAQTFSQIASRVLPPVPATQTAGLAPQPSNQPYSNSYLENEPLAAAANQSASRYAPVNEPAPSANPYGAQAGSTYGPQAGNNYGSAAGSAYAAAGAASGNAPQQGSQYNAAQTGYGQGSQYNYNPPAGNPAPNQYQPNGNASAATQPQAAPYQPSYANQASAAGAAYAANPGQPVNNPYAAAPSAPPAYGAAPEDRRQVWEWEQQNQPAQQVAQSPRQPAPQQPTAQAPPQQPAPQQPAPQQQAPVANHPPIALDGYCAVALNGEAPAWVKGDPRFGAVHRGRTYLFSSAAAQQQFMSDPDRYAPALSGYDPVRFVEQKQVVPGTRAFGWFYKDRYYLFADEAGLRRFEKSPEQYHEVVQQAMRGGPAGQQSPQGSQYR